MASFSRKREKHFQCFKRLLYEGCGSELSASIKDVLRHMTCRETKVIEFNGDKEISFANETFVLMLHEAAKEKGFELDSWSLDKQYLHQEVSRSLVRFHKHGFHHNYQKH